MGTYTDLLKLKPIPKQPGASSGEVVLADFSPPAQNTQEARAEITKVPHPPEPPAPHEASALETERTEDRTEKRSENRTGRLPLRRKTKRYSFEFFDDQIFLLKQLKREAEDRGEQLTMSDIAREALDRYLKSRKK
jgi:hypothetical protein